MRADKSFVEKVVYEFGEFHLNAVERVLETAGRPISVAPKALDVLIVLIENRGHIVDKGDLLKQVWPGTFVEENNLAFNISVLRKVLGESSTTPRFIETVPRRGYRFIADVRIIEKGVRAEESDPVMLIPDTLSYPLPPPSPGRRFIELRTVFYGAAFLAAIAMLVIWYRAKPKLTNRDTLVLAEFVNRTGDPVFDGTLRQGLSVELGQSPFLSIVPEAHVQRMLRLMARPPQTPLTPELAREVCQRTGSTVVVEGSISTLGTAYVLGIRATDCGGSEMVRNQQIQVKTKEGVLGALSQIARRFRSRVGESPTTLNTHNVPLEEATTASIDALRAYSQAWKIHAAQGATSSLPLFLRATELDPEFAMAHASLGRIYADLDQSDSSVASLTRAWQLRSRTSNRENFFISANYHLLVTGNLEEARKVAEAWTRTYPRDSGAHMMLSSQVNKVPGRFQDAVAEAEKAIAIDPEKRY